MTKVTRMTAENMIRLIGQTGILDSKEQGIGVQVKILDAKVAFHRTDVQVSPIAGTGNAWVSLGRIALDAPFDPTPPAAPVVATAPGKGKKGKTLAVAAELSAPAPEALPPAPETAAPVSA